MDILVCSDRDGTINEDDNLYLGKSPNWNKQVSFIPGVVPGIMLLNKVPNLEFFIITNQAGVAISYDPKDSEFQNLTEKRMHEVNRYIIEQLCVHGAKIRGYFACPFVDSAYAEKARVKGRIINSRYIRDSCPDRKPNTGLILKAASQLGKRIEECDIWTIGDRLADVQTGINAGGRGILAVGAKTEEIGDLKRTEELARQYPSRVFIEQNFMGAARLIAGNYGPINLSA